ncbi:MAG: anaerobic selenocysteine-containing dehydrogenase [Oleiphilaceae bacterium]|jgi:anaerobic selenocysteine-containing dehydrogenase/NADPH-dependent glutamate synthase beta subunit-like oxidoreductase
MTYVITDACSGAKHTSCVDVCPVDAFREGSEMLFIDPDVCISCNACFTECPVQAIYPEASVPEDQKQYIEINAIESKSHPVILERKSEDDKQTIRTIQPDKYFAVVGAGPSGFFTCEALLKQYPGASIDLIEKLPTPFGLVRFGVAPDHPVIKSVTDKFTQLINKNQCIKFFGNIEVGKDIQREALLEIYDSVIYTTGGSTSKPLPIKGHDFSGVYGSAEFVGWYNGHPEQTSLAPKLNKNTMTIIGMGNVALDIARIMCLPKDELNATDIAANALESISKSKVREVNIVARKGPAQAAFTPKELQQLIDHPGINLDVNPDDLILDPAIEASLDHAEKTEARENITLLRSILTRKSNATKTIRFIFNSNPEEVIGTKRSTKGLQVGINKVTLDKSKKLRVEKTGENKQIPGGIIISATGYQGKHLDGLHFDTKQGTIANKAGRAILNNGKLAEKEYVAGWIKRGASGVIGTNKQCAMRTVKTLVSDLEQQTPKHSANDPITLKKLLKQQGTAFFTFADWLALNSYESKNGRALNRPRVKVVEINEMLDVKAANDQLIAKANGKTASKKVPVKQFDASKPVQTHHRTCTLCEAMCGVVIKYQGDRIVSITGDKDDQHSKGHICPKGYALQDLHNDPERIKTPLKRIGDQWVPIDWDEALEEVAQRLVGVQKEYGNDAVGAYWGNPASHNLGLLLTNGDFKRAIQSRNMFSASSLDQMPHQLASHLMFGHSFLFSIPDIDRTDYMLMLGANPAASNGSLMTAGNVLERLEKIKERGGKLVLVDPRRTETALYASEHKFIKPGTDALLLLGLIQVIFNKDMLSLNPHLPLNGDIEALRPIANSVSLEEIAKVTEIPADEIERIAVEFSQAEKAVCYGRMGISVQEFGGLTHWLMQMLNIITGNLDNTGGMMFTTPAIDITDVMGRGSFAKYTSRVRNLPEVNREFPTSTMAEEMLTPGEGQIKAFVCTAGNPVISSPNSTRFEEALEKLDFMVSIDFYMNETSKHADIILPPSGPLEHEQYDLVFNCFAVRNVTRFSEPLFKKKSYMRGDHEIYTSLINRISQLKAPQNPIAQAKLKAKQVLKSQLTVERIIDLGLRNGAYGDGIKSYLPFASGKGLTIEKLKQYKSGLDLGPLEPKRLKKKLFTKDKKVQLFPQEFVDDLPRLQQFAKLKSRSANLLLIGRRDLRTNNSWMHNSQRLVKGKNRCDLFIHPETAKQLSIEQGENVYISSRVGALKVTVSITEDIMPNVVSLPHGWGHHREGMQITTASANPGVNVNDITDDLLMDRMSGNAALNGVPVDIQKIS